MYSLSIFLCCMRLSILPAQHHPRPWMRREVRGRAHTHILSTAESEGPAQPSAGEGLSLCRGDWGKRWGGAAPLASLQGPQLVGRW